VSYPVSVVIPTIDSRRDFLFNRCLPSVQLADPAQLIVIFGKGNGNEKRNAGARAATQPYLLFVDDDSEISSEILKNMVWALEAHQEASIAYSGYRTIQEADHSKYSRDTYPGKWSPDRLRRENYIDTTSLIRRSTFPGFDPEILRFQDWDLWLTMSARGARGVYLSKTLFDKYVIDENVSAKVPEKEAREAIVRKHNL
jgi:hypothetical protein